MNYSENSKYETLMPFPAGRFRRNCHWIIPLIRRHIIDRPVINAILRYVTVRQKSRIMKSNLPRIILTALLIIIPPYLAHAEWIYLETSNSGLSDENLTALDVDTSGNIWIGTASYGVNKFDGILTWTAYQKQASGLINDLITDIATDRYGHIWFATIFGISRFDGQSEWASYSDTNGLMHINIKVLTADDWPNIWLGTFGAGLIKFDGDTTFINYTADSGLIENGILSLLVDHDNNIWVGTYSGISKFDGVSSWTNFDSANSGLLDNTVLSVFEDPSGNLWFGSKNGVSRFDGVSGWVTYTTADGIAPGPVNVIALDSSGNIWLGHEAINASSIWVSKFDAQAVWSKYDIYYNAVGNVSVSDVTVDSSGTVWFATTGQGLTGYKADPSDSPNDHAPAVPTGFHLSQNYPNPFNSSTAIRYAIPTRSYVRISIHNILGQSICRPVDRVQSAGEHLVIWNGLDADHRPVFSGVYLYSVDVGDSRKTGRMVLLK